MQLLAALEFAMETPQASLVVLCCIGVANAAIVQQVYHLQHIVAYFLLMHHKEVVVHKLQVTTCRLWCMRSTTSCTTCCILLAYGQQMKMSVS